MSRWRLGLALLASSLAWPAHAESVQPVALDYSAHPGCPSEHEFFRELSARTGLVRRAEPSDDAEPVRVRIIEVPGGSRGELTIGAGDGGAKREVSAAHCEQLVAALALMTALAFDPDAIATPEPPEVPPAPEPPPPPASRSEPRPPPPAREPTHARTRFQAGVALELGNAVAAGVQPSVRPFLGVARERANAFGYAIRLSGGSTQGETAVADGAGELTLTSARLELCPLHVPPAGPLWLSGCAAFEAGQLTARGRDVSPIRRVARPWFATGVGARVELRLLEMLGLELGGALLFPLVRDRFFVQANSTLRRTEALVAAGAVGVSMHFP
jgi:hypothetical protein